MRLIDADKIVYFCGTTKSKHDPVTRGKIEKMPTVKAIPIEFIERKLAEHWYVDYDIRELLEDWEKENEKSGNSD